MTEHPIKELRRAGVPLAVFETADPAETIRASCASLNGKAQDSPIMQWDSIRALQGLNEAGKALVNDIAPDGPIQTGNLAECLALLAGKATEKSILFIHQLHSYLENASIAQALWNLRDSWKANGSICIGLAPGVTLPATLQQDMVVISEPLPDKPALEKVVESICRDAGIAIPAKPEMDRITDTLLGLSAFAAEQTLARSISKNGINVDKLWERKRRMIEQTPGLQVWQGGESFGDLGGLENLKAFLTRILTSGKTPIRALGFIDEIEKGMAGSAGDTSGTSQDQLQVFLKIMQDLNIPGIILIGPPGTGKSAIAKAAGNVAKAPVVAIDTGSMKGSLVGESERKIRAAMDVFKAISNGQGLFIATCNKIQSLPPELRRRFSLGTFFVDLPSADERAKIWPIWLKRYDLEKQTLPADAGWTGAEIRACCDVAYRADIPLTEAAKYVVPVSKSSAEQIDGLRRLAHGKFISASYAGPYMLREETQAQSTGRKLEV